MRPKPHPPALPARSDPTEPGDNRAAAPRWRLGPAAAQDHSFPTLPQRTVRSSATALARRSAAAETTKQPRSELAVAAEWHSEPPQYPCLPTGTNIAIAPDFADPHPSRFEPGAAAAGGNTSYSECRGVRRNRTNWTSASAPICKGAGGTNPGSYSTREGRMRLRAICVSTSAPNSEGVAGAEQIPVHIPTAPGAP
jgi:hypothetical protein